jgi:hypothetical protein
MKVTPKNECLLPLRSIYDAVMLFEVEGSYSKN